jgi:hypothetical protein
MKETSPDPTKEYSKKSRLILCPLIIKCIVSNSNESNKKYKIIEAQNEVH